MKKLLNKKGFTLMEMMIVIAIIVILVAIAVPSFSSSLDKANKGTDAANLRAAKAAGLVKAVDEEDGTYYFDLTSGELVKLADATSTPESTANCYGSCENHDDQWIKVTVANKTATTAWSDGSTDCE